MTWPTREKIAKVVYEAEEQARAKEEGEPAVWVPWEHQNSRREHRVYASVADAVLALFDPFREALTFIAEGQTIRGYKYRLVPADGYIGKEEAGASPGSAERPAPDKDRDPLLALAKEVIHAAQVTARAALGPEER